MNGTRLAPQYIFALVAALCAAALFLFFTLVIKPKQETLSTMQDDLSARQNTAAQYRQAAAAIPELKTQVAQLEVQRAEFVRALPTTTQFGQVLDQLRANASASKTEVTSLTFANGTTTDLPAGVRPVNISMGVKGEYGQLFQLMRSLETQNRFTTVNSLDLQLPEATSYNPKLQGNMALTVYTFDPTQQAAVTPGTAASGAPAAPAAPASGGQK